MPNTSLPILHSQWRIDYPNTLKPRLSFYPDGRMVFFGDKIWTLEINAAVLTKLEEDLPINDSASLFALIPSDPKLTQPEEPANEQWMSEDISLRRDYFYFQVCKNNKVVKEKDMNEAIWDIQPIPNTSFFYCATIASIQLWEIQENCSLNFISEIKVLESDRYNFYYLSVLPNSDVAIVSGSAYENSFDGFFSVSFYRFPQLQQVRTQQEKLFKQLEEIFLPCLLGLPPEIGKNILSYLHEYQFYRVSRSALFFKPFPSMNAMKINGPCVAENAVDIARVI